MTLVLVLAHKETRSGHVCSEDGTDTVEAGVLVHKMYSQSMLESLTEMCYL